MSIFSWFRRKPLPPWLDRKYGLNYAKFSSITEEFFKSKNISYVIDEQGDIHMTEGEVTYPKCFIVNTAIECSQHPVKHYEKIIRKEYNRLLLEKRINNARQTKDIEKIRQFLLTTMYILDSMDNNKYVSRLLAGEFHFALTFERDPSYFSPGLMASEAAEWGRSMEELLDIGLQNVKNIFLKDIKISKKKFQGMDLWFAESKHVFAPNLLPELQNRSDLLGKAGALVAIPNRNLVLICPVENEQVMPPVKKLSDTLVHLRGSGRGEGFHQVLWYRNGVFSEIAL